MGILEQFDRGAALYPARTCLVQGSASRSYRQVRAQTQRVARRLRALGLKEGERASVYSPNAIAAYEAMLGIYRAGAVFVPGNPKNHVDETVHVMTLCGVRALFYHPSLAADVDVLRGRCPELAHCISLDEVRALESEPEAEPLGVDRAPDALVALYSTGGTTGRPKCVMFTSRTWDTMTANLLAAIEPPRDPVYLLAAPMTHGAGSGAMALFSAGVTIVIHEAFDAAAVLGDLEKYRVTHFWLPPTAIYMLLAHPELRKHDYSALRYFMYAGSPIAAEKLKTAIEVFGEVMLQSYGQTEAPMFATLLLPREHVDQGQRLFSCGRPALLTRVEVMDEQGRLLPPGEPGEIVLRGDLVMAGYYGNPEATAEASQFGWHHTGDIGSRDEEGYFYIVDRKKDMIISGGFNVYPAEVEQVIMSHAAVQDCAVVGVPDDKWGEAVKAVLQLKPGMRVDGADIIALCKSRLGSIKAPKSVEIWDNLPRTPVNKVAKRDIREKFWGGHSRRV